MKAINTRDCKPMKHEPTPQTLKEEKRIKSNL